LLLFDDVITGLKSRCL